MSTSSAGLGVGWNISTDGLNKITQNGAIKDLKTILKNALDVDIKEIGTSVLSKKLTKSSIDEIVLQIQKIRNVAAPKANEDSQVAPRMLKLVLTDGDSYIQAVETSLIPSISRDKTPPGSKILITNASIVNGFLILNQSNCSLLGGKVLHLYEKWELAKSVQFHHRQASTTDGAPAWVNFGCKISGLSEESKSTTNKNVDSKEVSEFDLLRKGAIEEASTGAVKKVFGGSVKQPVNTTNVNDLSKSNGFNKGFTDNRNRGFNKNKKETDTFDIEEKLQKPSDKVSLFAFLEDKLPVNETSINSRNVNSFDRPVVKDYTIKETRPSNRYNERNDGRGEYQGQSNKRNYAQNYHTRPDHLTKNRADYSDKYPRNESGNQKYNSYNRPKVDHSQTQVNRPFKPPTDEQRGSFNQNSNHHHTLPNNFNKMSTNNQYLPKNFKQEPPSHPEFQPSVDNLANNLNKMSMNSQFASRSLKQQLNLLGSGGAVAGSSAGTVNPVKKNIHENNSQSQWNVGGRCIAKYWEDGKYYNATITATTDSTNVVKFDGYGNFEEVLKADCLPVSSQESLNERNRRSYKGPVEYRRSAKKFANS